jgi:hypothetical protein
MIIETMIIERASSWNKKLINYSEVERAIAGRIISEYDELLEFSIRSRQQLASGLVKANIFKVVERLQEENDQIIKMECDHNTTEHDQYNEHEQLG